MTQKNNVGTQIFPSLHSYMLGICDAAVTLFILTISTIFVFSFFFVLLKTPS